MPNSKKHAAVGLAVGGASNFLWQLHQMYSSENPPKSFGELIDRIDWLKVSLFAIGGAAVALVPDILEPASHPNHRALFHSVACGGAVTYAAFGKHTQRWSPEDRHALQVAALSYLSHLYLDAGTAQSLPMLC